MFREKKEKMDQVGHHPCDCGRCGRLVRVGVARGQWIYLLAVIIEFGASAAISKLGGEGILQTVEAFAWIIFFAALAINVGSMFVSARLFDQRMEL